MMTNYGLSCHPSAVFDVIFLENVRIPHLGSVLLNSDPIGIPGRH
jgi:hypothetical protein